MRTPHNSLISLLAASVLTGLAGIAAASDAPPEFVLDQWMSRLGVPEAELAVVPLPRRLTAGAEVALPPVGPVGGFGLSGTVALADPGTGLVRVLLVAEDGAEHLVLEAYSLALSADRVAFRNVCEETCVLPGVVPVRLRVEVIDATLDTTAIAYHGIVQARSRSRLAEPSAQARADAGPDAAVRDAQVAARVARLNERIEAKGLRWVAGDTPIARMTYAEKQALFGREVVPNLQGFEYYVGGVFDVSASPPASQVRSAPSALPSDFDWRNRHGANDPSSPYYDGDATGGGWMTSVKSQRCGDCWAHSASGAVEAQVNLFYNRHVDLDLSEQELVSCADAGSCSGGNPGRALRYVRDAGVVDEACFPSSGTDEPCGNRCPVPAELINIADYHVVVRSSEDAIKTEVLENGPIAFGIRSWWHCMVAAGYQQDPADGGTIWILKNSWGSGWGDGGYGFLRVPLDDVYLTYAIDRPVDGLVQRREIDCQDTDGDGYYNWGISSTPPDTCPPWVPLTPDCDDSDPTLGEFAADGSCVVYDVTWSYRLVFDGSIEGPPGIGYFDWHPATETMTNLRWYFGEGRWGGTVNPVPAGDWFYHQVFSNPGDPETEGASGGWDSEEVLIGNFPDRSAAYAAVDFTWGIYTNPPGDHIQYSIDQMGMEPVTIAWGFVELTLVTRVDIDVRPGHDINAVSNRFGMIEVAVLTTSEAAGDDADFDALQVDPATAMLGDASLRVSSRNVRAIDVDADGDVDLVLRFRARDAGIACADRSIELIAETYGGDTVVGRDAIRPVLCSDG